MTRISNKPTTKTGIFLLWTAVVLINSIVGFILALIGEFTSLAEILAIIAAIITFIFIYYCVDIHLLKKEKYSARKSLLLASLIKAALQLSFYIEIYSGLAATSMIEKFLGSNSNNFIFTYFTTILTGALLSLVVALLFGIITLIKRTKSK